jgi:predicted O-methyltransferase YrrM
MRRSNKLSSYIQKSISYSSNLQRGQVDKDSKFGKILSHYASMSDVFNIVEIGTWTGAGSTQTIVDALKERNNSRTKFTSIEPVLEFVEYARKNVVPSNWVEILHGRVVEITNNNTELDDLNDDEKEWLTNDHEAYSTSPNVLNALSDKIDLLFLDGGEFTTYTEFHLLKNRSRWIILDDTNSRKNRKSRRDVIASSQFNIIVDEKDDRNGYLVCENKLYNKIDQ